MTITHQFVVVFLGFALICGCLPTISSFYLGKVNIHLTNMMPDGKVATIHCKSGDNDLGEHKLGPGEDFHWEFGVNIFETTVFWCNIWCPYDGHTLYVGFHIYEAERDIGACGTNCERFIGPGGISFRNTETGSVELSYPWEHYKGTVNSHHWNSLMNGSPSTPN